MQYREVSLDAIRPSAERVTRLAHALFGGVYADIVWEEPGRRSRMVPFDGDDNDRFPSRHVLRTGKPLWIEDFATDPVALEYGLVAGSSNVRCFVGVPVHYQGVVLGALGAIDRKPRPYDERLMRRLVDLGELLSEAFLLARMATERAQNAELLASALEETARSEQRLKLAAALAKVHVWELDHGRREARSDETGDGGRPTEYGEAARTIWDHVHEDDRPEASALWADHVAGGPPLRTTYRLRRPDGEIIWVESAAEAVRSDSGAIMRVVGAIRNIEADKKREQDLIEARNAAEAADAAKSVFLATISHEIRTPLNGILGMAQAMANETLPQAQAERLSIIRQSGESLLAIVNDVLDLSKIAAGKLELEVVEFDLMDLTAAAKATFEAVALAKGLTLDLRAQGAGGIYRGDPVRIRQILYNLISNALKFTDRGGVAVSLRRAADGLIIEVADTGVGIPPERQASLFQPFVQVDASTTRRFGGTGLGLSICRELAERMGGDITLESAPRRGSRFICRLPLAYVGSMERPTAPVPASPERSQEGASLRVLAAEDNKTNQLVLSALLAQIGIEPVIVDNGKLALEAWRTEAWDLILMDVRMPEMDGLQATRTIRDEEGAAGGRRTPIIALTANAMAHQADDYYACGMDGVVSKPIEVARLFATIEAVLADPDVETRKVRSA